MSIVRKLPFGENNTIEGKMRRKRVCKSLTPGIAKVLNVPLSCPELLRLQLINDIGRRVGLAIPILELIKDLRVDSTDLPAMRRIWFYLFHMIDAVGSYKTMNTDQLCKTRDRMFGSAKITIEYLKDINVDDSEKQMFENIKTEVQRLSK